MDQGNSEKALDTYDEFVGAKVCLLDQQCRKMTARVTNRVNYNKGNTRGSEQPAFYTDQKLYEVSLSNGQTKELTANVISENMLSQID